MPNKVLCQKPLQLSETIFSVVISSHGSPQNIEIEHCLIAGRTLFNLPYKEGKVVELNKGLLLPITETSTQEKKNISHLTIIDPKAF